MGAKLRDQRWADVESDEDEKKSKSPNRNLRSNVDAAVPLSSEVLTGEAGILDGIRQRAAALGNDAIEGRYGRDQDERNVTAMTATVSSR